MNKIRTLLLLAVAPLASAAADDLDDACLLGQETAALFYDLLQSDPERARRILDRVDTDIARRAFYWATVYIEKQESMHSLATAYLEVCLETGPVRMPPPQI